MSTLSHNFYGFNKLNSLGEVDPAVFCKLGTGYGDAIAPSGAQNVNFTKLLHDPMHIALKDGAGYVGFRIPVTGVYDFAFITTVSQSGGNQATYQAFTQSAIAFDSSGRLTTDGARFSICDYGINIPSASGTFTLMLNGRTLLKAGTILYSRVSVGAGAGTVTTGNDYATNATLRLISQDPVLVGLT